MVCFYSKTALECIFVFLSDVLRGIRNQNTFFPGIARTWCNLPLYPNFSAGPVDPLTHPLCRSNFLVLPNSPIFYQSTELGWMKSSKLYLNFTMENNLRCKYIDCRKHNFSLRFISHVLSMYF